MIVIELYGYHDGEGELHRRPWWAVRRVYTEEGDLTVSSRRCASAWEAVRSVLELLPLADGAIQVARPGDGRYIPSPSVDYSTQEEVTMEGTYSNDAVDELIAAVQVLLQNQVDPHEGIMDTLNKALGRFLTERKRAELWLPWRAQGTSQGHIGNEWSCWRVVDSRGVAIADALNEAQAMLIAGAAPMAEALEELLEWSAPRATLSALNTIELARSSLVVSGWVSK
jgi:hypothetical protein